MAKQKVCFLIPGFGEGGAQKQCIYLINELQNNSNLEIHLIYFYEEVNFGLLEQNNLTLWKLSVGSFYNPINIVKIYFVIRKICPDILYSWLHSCDVYAYAIKRLIKNIVWIVAERNSWYPPEPRFLLRKYLASSADLILCNSYIGCEYWKKNNVSVNKIHFVQNILQKSTGQAVKNLSGSPILLFAGRLEAQKNIINLVKSFCKLADSLPDGLFLIIGNGSLLEEIQNVINEFKMHNQVIILPFQKQIVDYFVTADVFVNLSLHEGMPNTVIENIALNKKIVVSKIPEHVDILGEDYPFYVENLDDVDEIVSVLKKAVSTVYSPTIYTEANQKLNQMSASIVAKKYTEFFTLDNTKDA